VILTKLPRNGRSTRPPRYTFTMIVCPTSSSWAALNKIPVNVESGRHRIVVANLNNRDDCES
jgi:hypothetical protein